MKSFRLILAFLVGVWLYYTAVVLVGGVLAAIAVPKAYFAFFGRGNAGLALAVLSLATWAAPVALLVCAGLLALHRVLAAQAGTAWFGLALLGLVAGFALCAIASGASELRFAFQFPWWAAPSFFAPWVGAAIAAWLIHRGSSGLVHARGEA